MKAFPRPVPPERQPAGMIPEIVLKAEPDDERVWVPLHDNVWFRPLLLNTVEGYWTSLLRVRAAGVVSVHRHPAPVHGYVIKGQWRYLEHDWVATEGSYVFEPPGETHTLVIDEGVEEMITWFLVNGSMLYVDDKGDITGYADVFQRIELCRAHYIKVGLGADFVNQFIR
ncbi:MAG: 2,4'-dihydroxyacetophenone dioxygenase family protein [Rhodopseudomonas sp.]|uniref:2,4'-dihydroxyacetophenone dioxygenase family protein n=1 Tax=Rhodopseudomonas sp. TaxID=1078 RepID=UPI00183C9EEB|nr:2,4'-dihydroxyacetophenone dioxygenase family protein [Rhodopseudomonas sp.]NVN87792.1 2,4'-dihydroxyacetophenone dioxygenase family protein [Rhodopseudomonas sp.]